MNILSVGGRYKPTNGGNAKRISTMCEEFSKQGNTVVVMTCDQYNSEIPESENNGVTVLRFSNYRVLIENIQKVIDRFKIQVVLVHEETYLRFLVGKHISAPLFYECHAIEPNPNKAKECLLNVLRKRYYNPRWLKGVFVLSQNAGKVFAKKYGYPAQNIVYTPNGLDKSSTYVDSTHFNENPHFIYGYSGTLYEFQGINNIIRYAEDILAIAEDVQIMIVGGGPLEMEVRKYVESHRLEDRIILTGSVPQEEFDRLTQNFDVVLMPRPRTPSTESAVPLKIFDAAIHKKPVIMSNVSGLTEAFSEEAALIYPAEKQSDIVKCCRQIYRNTQLALRLVEGESKALSSWPTVAEVAARQLQVMRNSI